MNIVIGNSRIELLQGDITEQWIDAIVNAANSSLRGGGGVDGAIHRFGGQAIDEECIALEGCETGDAKATTAGDLPAKHVIHTVGPVYGDGNQGEAELLAQCHWRCLEVANNLRLQSVAFPAISCGVYGYPVDEAAAIATRTVAEHVKGATSIRLVRFVLFTRADYETFRAALSNVVE